ncbi:hypothetical protein SAMN05421770_106113 [Granulicella rosea]|uniref:SPOR domain-containing protein n=1 Tax=Granulicella rosea TaxID=474952 RepID=A0A239L6G4_9BACT|nr:hypothetical protein [Granulicella rosea]SNT25508.1 hypothetical protein SAMN05421770_106113 [Granulicella rosea]
MHLWSDYEGKTIAEAYPLGQLIRPEGRTAFFATANGTGTPAVIRLTESLNDEHEMLSRWQQVADLGEEHLVTIKKFGQTSFDGTPLAYALLELTDASLADILRERPLTPAETVEVGHSLVAALKALHAKDLVHEHLTPESVLAVGEVIKLRSDCVREATNDLDHTPEALKQRDVHALAELLLRCLTLDANLTPATRLAAPFDRIVPRGLDGAWGLDEIDAALTPPPTPEVKPLVPEGVIAAAHAAAETHRLELADAAQAEPYEPVQAELPLQSARVSRIYSPVKAAPKPPLFWGGVAAAALLALFVVWHLVQGRPVTSATATAPAAPATVAPSPIKTIDDAPNPPAAKAGVATVATQPGWHVVAYTYNHEDQAWQKVASLRAEHSSLRPEVFSPSGRAPFLVTLGGGMSRAEAEALRRQARKDGLPRDVFTRDYRAR